MKRERKGQNNERERDKGGERKRERERVWEIVRMRKEGGRSKIAGNKFKLQLKL